MLEINKTYKKEMWNCQSHEFGKFVTVKNVAIEHLSDAPNISKCSLSLEMVNVLI